jgi:hypothetical protein
MPRSTLTTGAAVTFGDINRLPINVPGTPNKFTIGRMEAAIAAERPEFTYLQRQKALATALADRWEKTKRYTAAEERAIEVLSRVLDRIMPYLHHKRAAGDSADHPINVSLDLKRFIR